MSRKPTIDTESVAQDQIRAFVEQIEQLREQRRREYNAMFGLGNLNEKNSFGDDVAADEADGPAPHETRADAPTVSANQSTAARTDVPRRDELAGPVHVQDGSSPAPQNDPAGGTAEVSAGVESAGVGRVEQPEAGPRSNGSQAGTQAPPVDTTSAPVTHTPGGPMGGAEPQRQAPVPSMTTDQQHGTAEPKSPTMAVIKRDIASGEAEASPPPAKLTVPKDGLYSADLLRRHNRCLHPDACEERRGRLCEVCSHALAVHPGGTSIEQRGTIP